MLKWEDIKDVEPLVEELLTVEEVMEILSSDYGERLHELTSRRYYNATEYRDVLNGYPRVTIYDNTVFHNWDGTNHDGVYLLVQVDNDTLEEYSMERTYTDITIGSTSVSCKPKYHRLLPIDTLRGKKRISKYLEYSASELVQLIVHNATIDNITIKKNADGHYMKLSPRDAFKSRIIESGELLIAFEEHKTENLRKLTSGTVPAGDELWGELILGELAPYKLEVFQALREKGHHIRFDGERDSFGWGTCAIIMDGVLMTDYF